MFDIKTISMHGSPLSKYNNSNMWKNNDFKLFGIVGDAQLSINNVNYYTDTGGKWNSQYNVRDYMNCSNNEQFKNLENKDIIKMLNNGVIKGSYFNMHPERWASDKLDEIKIQMRDFIYNFGKHIIHSLK